jgi:hypothetical protein
MLILKPTHSTSGGGGGQTNNNNNNSALVPLHLEIVPLEHHSSLLQCDEEVLKEVQRYKQCVSHMYAREAKGGSGALFSECAIRSVCAFVGSSVCCA